VVRSIPYGVPQAVRFQVVPDIHFPREYPVVLNNVLEFPPVYCVHLLDGRRISNEKTPTESPIYSAEKIGRRLGSGPTSRHTKTIQEPQLRPKIVHTVWDIREHLANIEINPRIVRRLSEPPHTLHKLYFCILHEMIRRRVLLWVIGCGHRIAQAGNFLERFQVSKVYELHMDVCMLANDRLVLLGKGRAEKEVDGNTGIGQVCK